MMEDISQQLNTDSIRQAVADGSYFKRSRRWFDEVYHRPIGERSYFIMLMFLSAVTIFFSTLTYISMQPLSRTIPYTIYSNDLFEEMPLISKLREYPSEDINVAIIRFLLKDYVTQREDYRYDVVKLEWQFNRMRSTSSEDEFQRYQAIRNPQNPGSPFNKYRQDGVRKTNVYSQSFNLDDDSQSAKVYFTSTVTQNKTVQTNNWVANITFRFPELRVNQETNEVMQFNPQTQAFEIVKEIDFRVSQYNVQETTNR